MSNMMEKYLVRIENIDGHGVGAGFLINKMEVATCAHVVSTVLGFGRRISFEAPQDAIYLTFPFIQKEVRLQAYVVGWDHANDIAILRLKSVPPAAAEPACFSGEKISALRNHPVRTYGFPNGYNDGTWSNDWKIKDKTADNQVQLESDTSTGKPIEGGFSGAPVFDEQLNQVVGMIAATDRNIERKVAFMIQAEAIARVWPILLEKQNDIPSHPVVVTRNLRMHKMQFLMEMLKIANEERFYAEQIDQIKDKLFAEMIRDQDSNIEISKNTYIIEKKLNKIQFFQKMLKIAHEWHLDAEKIDQIKDKLHIEIICD